MSAERRRAAQLALQGQRFLVTGHRRPDADALGSALGFAAAVRSLGKEAVVFIPEQPAHSIEFLLESHEVVTSLPAGARFDSAWVMDTPAEALLPPGFPGPEVTGPVVVVDHHGASEAFGDLALREVDACATGEVVVRLMRDLGIEAIPQPAAEPLYAALISDTGGFRYPGTRPDTLRLGARLLERGVDPWRVAYHLFEDWAPEQLRLLGAVIERMRTPLGGRLAIVGVPRSLLEELGAEDSMIEGLVNYGRALHGVEVSALAWELPGGSDVKVSLRSRGEADVAALAVALGGGGHRNAAGAQLEAALGETLQRVEGETACLLDGS